MSRSREGYLKTLRRDPEYWDAKYNYEYVSMLLDRLQGDEAHSEEEMKLLLEKMRTDMPGERRCSRPRRGSDLMYFDQAAYLWLLLLLPLLWFFSIDMS